MATSAHWRYSEAQLRLCTKAYIYGDGVDNGSSGGGMNRAHRKPPLDHRGPEKDRKTASIRTTTTMIDRRRPSCLARIHKARGGADDREDQPGRGRAPQAPQASRDSRDGGGQPERASRYFREEAKAK